MENKDNDSLVNFVKESRKISEKIKINIESLMETFSLVSTSIDASFKEASKGFKAISDGYLASQASLCSIVQEIQIPKVSLPNLKLPDLENLVEKVGGYQAFFQKAMFPVFVDVQKSMEALPPKIKTALAALVSQGWYLDLGMTPTEVWALQKEIEAGCIESVEDFLVGHFSEQLECIAERVLAKSPKRAEILEAAFKAHRNGDFSLSIPVFLAQTDGICKECADKYLFMRRENKPQIAKYVERFTAESFKEAILSPLGLVAPINASTHERGPDFRHLNRHMVLHGESTDYGTEKNSLKCISLVNYVTQVLKSDFAS